MLKDASSIAANERIRHEQESASAVSRESDAPVLSPEEYRILDAIQRRVLWLSTLMIHHANNVRSKAHSLAFLGSLYGVPTVPLGVDRFGQSGSQADLYQYTEIGVEDIVGAGYLAWELGENS
jgi:transketolase